ncbi:hypothetical protein ACFXKW_25140, partial [Streptomyces sp. NPDC059193]|uniref:hypothetical protein n=1 Tax=Streptomyces sp. NPDC059193 TaxID=3346763 RepID=UPI0036BC124E
MRRASGGTLWPAVRSRGGGSWAGACAGRGRTGKDFCRFRETAGGAAPVLLGSAKANLGHTESAAGVLGVIKSKLSL